MVRTQNEIEIEVDIKPDSHQPFINVAARTLVPLAILSTSAFDAPVAVDPASVRLADAPVKLNEAGDAQCRSRDVNRDGLDDLLCHMQPTPHELNVGAQMMRVGARAHDSAMLTGQSAIDVMPQGTTLGGMRALMLD